jgi:hypothetical protein
MMIRKREVYQVKKKKERTTHKIFKNNGKTTKSKDILPKVMRKSKN